MKMNNELSEHLKIEKFNNHFATNMALLTVLAEINNLLKNPDVSSAMSSSNALAAKGFPLFFLTITGEGKLKLSYILLVDTLNFRKKTKQIVYQIGVHNPY